MGHKTLCKLHQRYNLDNTYTLEINNIYSISIGVQFKFDQNLDRVKINQKIWQTPLLHPPLACG